MAQGNKLTFPPIVFKTISLLFAGAAVFHVLGLVAPEWVAPEPRWRHACYFGLDTLNAVFILRRPAWQVVLLWAIATDQFWSHGETAYRAWIRNGQIDWISLGVLIFMPCVLFLTTADWAHRRGA